MLPTVITKELKEGITSFLESTFPITTPAFREAFDEIFGGDGRSRMFRGPYLRVGLPFKAGSGTLSFFKRMQTRFPPHLHQEKAWERLKSEHARSTLIATGTGSGKTECFLYPILDHILSVPSTGGIKAVLLYPMNALATDQARRFASEIYENPALRGKVRVGLYVGGDDGVGQDFMSEEGVITDRNALRTDPPDILMTNYKMLDFLLIRPEDRGIWEQNHSEALKYLVVDELHTFDGAQGSDLACLIRRLKARLATPKGHLCCVGTSATLGYDDQDGGASLRKFAEDIFGESFPESIDTIVTEARLTPAEHIGANRLESVYMDEPGEEALAMLQAEQYPSIGAYVAAQFRLWFPGIEADDFSGIEAQWDLAEKLRDHRFLRTLLAIVGERSICSDDELKQEIKQRRPNYPDQRIQALLESFLSLCAVAKDRLPNGYLRPFLQIRSELWMRELSRMVASVEAKPKLKYSIDLPVKPLLQHLPVVHCRECGIMAWAARRKANTAQMVGDLQKFYDAWFSYYPDPRLCMMVPLPSKPEGEIMGDYLCGNCLSVFQSTDGTCRHCGTKHDSAGQAHAEPNRVTTIPIQFFNHTRNRGEVTIADLKCPCCQSASGLTVVGSRSASLTSVALSQLFGSPYNDDKKAMAFSDSVQDASHRAGFFGARTYSIVERTALQKCIDQQKGPVDLATLSRTLPQFWLKELGEDDFAGTFIPPDYEWTLDYEFLEAEGVLPMGSTLPGKIADRLTFDTIREFGLQARVGRTLEKSGSASIGIEAAFLNELAAQVQSAVREKAGVSLDAAMASWVILSLCERLRRNGGIYHEFLDDYIRGKGKDFLFNRRDEMQNIPRPGMGRRPTFFSTFTHRDSYERLIGSGSARSWIQRWLEKSLNLVDNQYFIEAVVDVLVKSGLWRVISIESSDQDRAWALNPEKLMVVGGFAELICDACGHALTVYPENRTAWLGCSCMKHDCNGSYRLSANQETRYFGKLYRKADLVRMRSREHTGLLKREERESLEQRFIRPDSRSTDPKLLSCTPTLEMGVDVGDLASVILCSVPPAQANYAQRIGRGGRRDGNSIGLTIATNQAHDLSFYEAPEKMIQGAIEMPAIFLNAPAVLERQVTAYCLDCWVKSEKAVVIPKKMEVIYAQMASGSNEPTHFPNGLLDYIEGKRSVLLEGFLGLFSQTELKQETVEHLKRFIEGNAEQQTSLAYKIQVLLSESARNRDRLFRERSSTIKAIGKNRSRKPRDEKLDDELEKLSGKRQALSRLIKQFNTKDTLNFLTDEGILPNYAFPEEGVVLRSVILKKPEKQAGPDSKLIKEEYEHMRPAEAAISELAPGSSFYVQGRKLTVDRVSIDEDDYELWHFCRNCNHVEPVSAESESRVRCPKCGDSGWRDQSLKQSMLKMRQVFVTAWDRYTRSGDQSDTRDLTSFNKQLSISYEPEAIDRGYCIQAEGIGFSFEFLRQILLREVNFGSEKLDQDSVQIGGRLMRGVGFKVCPDCGKIWKPNRSKHEQMHDIACKYYGTDEEVHFNRSLLLYRMLRSEGIRIMIPSLSEDYDAEAQSFVAALHLGLRKKFGGYLSHIRLNIQQQPIPNTELKTQHVFLYDSVPGGTGYLKELTRSGEALLEILELGYEALKNCSCQSEDGCYQCVKSFRFRHVDNLISRAVAIRQFEHILNHRDKLEERIADESLVNPLIESELEKRFIEAIRREKGFKLENNLRNGKPGFLLRIGETTWYLNLQQNLGEKDGLSQNCRPDVIFEPLRPLVSKPVAVFLDGYTYHANEESGNNRIADDFSKRNSIWKTGKYQVFSLTWQDVQNEKFDDDAFLGASLNGLKTLIKGSAEDIEVLRNASWNSFDLLMGFLRACSNQQAVNWEKLSCFVAMTGALKSVEDMANLHQTFETWVESGTLPEVSNAEGDSLLLDTQALPFRLLSSVPLESVRCKEFKDAIGLLWFDDKSINLKAGDQFREKWREFLRASNILQFMPRFVVATRYMFLKGRLDNAIDWLTQLHFEPIGTPAQTEFDLVLSEEQLLELHVLDKAIGAVLVPMLKSSAVPYPEFGYEAVSSSDECVEGMLEVAWPRQKVGIYLQGERIDHFLADGWTLVESSHLSHDSLNSLFQPQ